MGSSAILFTVYNRPDYLAPVLETWRRVRGLAGWTFQFRFEPSSQLHRVADLVDAFIRDTGVTAEVVVNTQRLGVLFCPWIGFEDLFRRHDFVLRAEDDLIVSDDFLEYFDWARVAYQDDQSIGAICSAEKGTGEPETVTRRTDFNPLNWGTWRDRWTNLIGPTWDKDYSTFNVLPGYEAGWDWNLKTRVFPAHELQSIFPAASRTDNLGVWGTHATPENYYRCPSFQADFGRTSYVEV